MISFVLRESFILYFMSMYIGSSLLRLPLFTGGRMIIESYFVFHPHLTDPPIFFVVEKSNGISRT